MLPVGRPAEIKQALFDDPNEARSMLFVWLTSEPEGDREYVDMSKALIDAGERNLAHLVIHRGMALFPDSDTLALCALQLELRDHRSAA